MARRRRRHRYNNYGGWPPYVPVAERRAQAKYKVNKLRKQGQDIQPIEIEGRTIARSFWGKGWCKHLESFGDYSNRLPRGRSYVRNGSVCHLAITQNKIEAIVSGSKMYNVTVNIKPLKKKKWNTLKQRCTGKIGSLIELLQGKLSEEIMRNVTDQQIGLFPLPGEIQYECDCPDWADMCKHISAVMYGIGARLDDQPELLFLLRGVDHNELISAEAAADTISGKNSRQTKRRTLSNKEMENVFGVELDETQTEHPKVATQPPKRRKTPEKTRKKNVIGASKRKQSRAKARQSPMKKKKSFKPTARSISRLRKKLSMSKAAFARTVGVSATTVSKWENASGTVKPRAQGLAGLTRLYNQVN